MIHQKNCEDPIARAVGLFKTHRESNTGVSTTHPLSFRVETITLLYLDAMAQAAGVSRSAMINRCVDVGLYAIRDALPPEALERLGDTFDELARMHIEKAENEGDAQ